MWSVKSGMWQPFAFVALQTTGSRLRWLCAGVKFSFACTAPTAARS